MHEEEEPDFQTCPSCGGPADNGHDRCLPPNPYLCTKCSAESPLRTDPTELAECQVIEDIEFVASKEQNPVLMAARILELCSYRAEVATPGAEGLRFHLPLGIE